jgi:hypothetical protein
LRAAGQQRKIAGLVSGLRADAGYGSVGHHQARLRVLPRGDHHETHASGWKVRL